MILKRPVLEAIRDGSVELVFRRWRRPTVKAGGTLRTAVGVLAVDAVDSVSPDEITASEAVLAGFKDPQALRRALNRRSQGRVYRIRVRYLGADPRVALREQMPEGGELRELVHELVRRGRRSTPAPRRVLELIRDQPATLAAELADELGLERMAFKRRVRALKELGLTESLERGYRLSPRGAAALEALSEADAGRADHQDP